MIDKFDKFRASFGADAVDTFLAAFGMGPKYKPSERKVYLCQRCGKENAFYKEYHPDTDMNEILLTCPDCGFIEDGGSGK